MAPKTGRGESARASRAASKSKASDAQVPASTQEASQASKTPQSSQASAAIGVLKNQYMLKPVIAEGQTETEQFRLPLNLLIHWFFAKSRITTDQASASLGCCS